MPPFFQRFVFFALSYCWPWWFYPGPMWSTPAGSRLIGCCKRGPRSCDRNNPGGPLQEVFVHKPTQGHPDGKMPPSASFKRWQQFLCIIMMLKRRQKLNSTVNNPLIHQFNAASVLVFSDVNWFSHVCLLSFSSPDLRWWSSFAGPVRISCSFRSELAIPNKSKETEIDCKHAAWQMTKESWPLLLRVLFCFCFFFAQFWALYALLVK